MDLISHLFNNPVLFFSLLAILCVVSVAVAIFLWRGENKFKDFQNSVKEKTVPIEEFEKIKSELAVRNQMYEGLKGQYDELEKDFEKITRELEELKAVLPKEQPKPAQENTQNPPIKPNNADNTIVNLLHQLKNIQEPPKT